ncbi:MAG: hypothetical protein ABIS51_02810 [Sphingomonas sp.]
MIARDLERLLVILQAPASIVDLVTRDLRENGAIPTGGRGPNAPRIGAVEAAAMLIALAGADVASQAYLAIAKVKGLRFVELDALPRHDGCLVTTLRKVLGDPPLASEIHEIRVCRNLPLAEIFYKDGAIERFVHQNVIVDPMALGGGCFRSEGVLPGALLEQVALKLLGTASGWVGDKVEANTRETVQA